MSSHLPEKTPIVAVVIPAFNEAATVVRTLKSFLELPEVSKVVLIDNNSNDGTFELAQEIQLKNRKLVILKELKKGKGYAIRNAFRSIEADYYVMVDADATYSSNDLHKLLEMARNGYADMIVGNRLISGVYANQNSRLFHNFGNHLIKKIINKLYNASLGDILSGYRVMTKRFVHGFPILSRGFELETEITLHALDRGYSIVEVPISYIPRPHGSESKLRTFYDGRKILFKILNIYRIFQPLKFFGLVSFTFFISALFSGYKPINDYIKFQFVYHVPLAILSSSLMILATLSLMTAFILDAAANQSTKNFEMLQTQQKNKN
jgi:glycosyltransferase involved in cell wall biosynthesis